MSAGTPERRSAGARLRASAPALITTVVTLAVLLAGWQLAISVTNVNAYLTKSPVDVWNYLFVDGTFSPESAAERRAALVPMIGVTVYHAGIGLVFGVSLGLVGSVLLSVSRTLRAMFLPIALVLQTVPLIAMAPVIYAVFGAGVVTAAVIAGVVTFFPLLMNLGAGLSAASPETVDLVHAYGGGRAKLLVIVQLPAALPYLFAGLKIAAPAVISAATLYEFLFSFEGLGANLLTSRSYSDYGLLWTLVVVTIALALVAYGLVVLLERLVLAGRYPPESALARRGGLR
ncbi:ABC transporter permease [Herbiconiux flava]|uniref:ABC-type nitrate/sulfonate/bicarbonate transport system permease component n=1 Tax=Herbiconiux flava TaxID=881268 RepID=A0A852SQ46_9MICO|nr:ABC transporter permease subunit [Herbiconiux flava]NYD70961.1 ABC-type nitrate/sulfonate/bicarbonate transport system permease component [Herbiconiux flava]GLK19077.1 ABC transporter permease [Herbiconiux flava]